MLFSRITLFLIENCKSIAFFRWLLRFLSHFCLVKYYNIPIFMPEMACPFRCVYCNQFSIAGKSQIPDVDFVRKTIENHLATFPEKERFVEVAFFGGNFTGLPEKMQDDYLRVVQPFIESGEVQGIRCSTRPDYIDQKRLKVLKQLGMRNIELGAQSTNDGVLLSCGRGHDFKAIERASQLILDEGFTLGLQMMIGLPGSSPELDRQTARDIVRLGAKETRIYPCLVVKDTVLAKRYLKGDYQPLSVAEAVQRSADIYTYFVENGVKVLRIGLHPSDELDGGDCLAGPYHHNFAEMVHGEVWRRRFETIGKVGSHLTIKVHPSQRTHAIGYEAANKKALLQRYQQVDFVADASQSIDSFAYEIQSAEKRVIIASSLMPEQAKARLQAFGEVLWLEPTDFVYPSIAAHPDIYFFQYAENQLVFAPNTPKEWIAFLHQKGVKLMRGRKALGHNHPETTFYNACGTTNLLVHNLKHTDERILRLYEDKTQINVNQAYTRCNLFALNDKAFITSDEGIFRILTEKQFDVLFIDPHQIHLEGHDYGFFPGCCGVFGNQLLVCGNTQLLKEKEALDAFLTRNGFSLVELHDGVLVDLGGIYNAS